jgi:hypothetical protein
MDCPTCGAATIEVTDSWHTFAEATGAEYLATYVTIWHCPRCRTMIGASEGAVDWVIEPEEALREE